MKLRALLSLLFLAGACVAPMKPDEANRTEFLPASGLDQFQPADIAVAQVRVQTLDGGSAPTELLRGDLYQGLISRLYTPLTLDWVDGGGASDATLQVRILKWDRSRLAYDGTVLARAEARLVNSKGSLWAVDITRRLNRRTSDPNREDPNLTEASCTRDLAAELLQLLPMRDPMRP